MEYVNDYEKFLARYGYDDGADIDAYTIYKFVNDPSLRKYRYGSGENKSVSSHPLKMDGFSWLKI